MKKNYIRNFERIKNEKLYLSRKWHRGFIVIIAIPLFSTIMSDYLFTILLAFAIDAFWLTKLHTGNFGFINLQFIYSPIIGFSTLVILFTGVSLLRRP